MPQYLPLICVHASGEQDPESAANPQTLVNPAPPQVCVPGQPPQSVRPPQPSPTMPQYWPLVCAQTVGVQEPESVEAPQTFGRPAPPQVCEPGQAPQSMRPPQPLPTMPQYFPFICMQL